MSSAEPRLAVLVSGEGTNLQALIDAAAAGQIHGRIGLVLSNVENARGLQRARQAGVDARYVPVKSTRTANYDGDLKRVLEDFEADLIILAGYMRILSPEFTTRFSDRTLNLHPSLLPRYKGVNTHRRVLDAGDRHHGATVHFVTAVLDGGPAVVQYRLAVAADDTEQTLSARVHLGEHIILPKAVAWFCEGRLKLESGRVIFDGYPLAMPIVFEESS